MKALVIGGADCIWTDVQASERLFGAQWWDLVVAANDIGCHWPRRLDAWATLHVEKMQRWREDRDRRGHPAGYVTYSRSGKKRRGIDETVHHRFGGGASGLLAVSVALHLGADRIVVCGVPMTKSPHFDESAVHPKGKPWPSPDAHWKKWRHHAAVLSQVIRSMSGRTQEMFGAPTADWLGITTGTAGGDHEARRAERTA